MIEEKEKPFKLDVVSIRLVKDAPLFSDKPFTNPAIVAEALGEKLCEMDREVLFVINLKTNGVPINCACVSVGTLNGSLAVPREVFKSSILSNAASIVLLHNHPSGSLEPSTPDIAMTAKMSVAGHFIGIEVLDHIIVGGDNSHYYSFAENDMMLNIQQKAEQIERRERQFAMAAERGRSR